MIGTLVIILAVLIFLAVASIFVARMHSKKVEYMDHEWFIKK